MIQTLRFSKWAQPVTNRKWAIVTAVLDTAKRRSGYRLFVHASAKAWGRATGSPV